MIQYFHRFFTIFSISVFFRTSLFSQMMSLFWPVFTNFSNARYALNWGAFQTHKFELEWHFAPQFLPFLWVNFKPGIKKNCENQSFLFVFQCENA